MWSDYKELTWPWSHDKHETVQDVGKSFSFMLGSTKKLQADVGRGEEDECCPHVHRL